MDAMNAPLLTIPETAELLGVSAARAYELAREGILPVVHIGRQKRVSKEQLQAWVDQGGRRLPGGWRKKPHGGSNAGNREGDLGGH